MLVYREDRMEGDWERDGMRRVRRGGEHKKEIMWMEGGKFVILRRHFNFFYKV